MGNEEIKQKFIEAGFGFYAGDLLQQRKKLSYDDIIDQDIVYRGIAPHQAHDSQELFAQRVTPAFR